LEYWWWHFAGSPCWWWMTWKKSANDSQTWPCLCSPSWIRMHLMTVWGALLWEIVNYYGRQCCFVTPLRTFAPKRSLRRSTCVSILCMDIMEKCALKSGAPFSMEAPSELTATANLHVYA
jgi:hypothetical protein